MYLDLHVMCQVVPPPPGLKKLKLNEFITITNIKFLAGPSGERRSAEGKEKDRCKFSQKRRIYTLAFFVQGTATRA
jgi:hypothetical protein